MSAREWLYEAWWSPARQDAMRDALLAVLDIHEQRSMTEPWCDWDAEGWPCATVRAIDKALGVTDE